MRRATHQRFFEVSYSITRILSDTRDSPVAVLSILQSLCKNFEFDMAGFWIVADTEFRLKCVRTWLPNADAALSQFEQLSLSRQFHPNEGLPGRVWTSREAIWLSDIAHDSNFPRAAFATSAGLRTAVAFPLQVSGGVLGVIELFSRKSLMVDDDLLGFLQTLGGQIGVFLEYSRLKSNVKELDAQLRLLADTSSDVVLTIDEHSNILFANAAAFRLLGHHPDDLIGKKLFVLIPERFHAAHEHGLKRFIQSGVKNITWEGIVLPALHKNGIEFDFFISFGEFIRGGQRVFTGFMRKQGPSQADRQVRPAIS